LGDDKKVKLTSLDENSAGAGNSFGTKDHDLHRTRRGPVAKFFSQAMIARLEGEIHGMVHRLCDKLLAEAGRKEPIDVAMAYSCFTSDAIFGYCFGEEQGFLRQEGWYPNHREATLAVLKPVFFLRFFPVLAKLQDYAIL
jgi:cytochrome P450